MHFFCHYEVSAAGSHGVLLADVLSLTAADDPAFGDHDDIQGHLFLGQEEVGLTQFRLAAGVT